MPKEWKPINWEHCEDCGDDLKVLTDCLLENHAYDGDLVRCVSCDARGWVSVDEEGSAWVNMDYETHVFNPYKK